MKKEGDIFEISEHFIKVVFPLKEMAEENKNSHKANGDENGDVKKILLLLKQEPENRIQYQENQPYDKGIAGKRQD